MAKKMIKKTAGQTQGKSSTLSTSEILEKLFGSAVLVRLMRFFLANKTLWLSAKEVITKTAQNPEDTKKTLRFLEKLGFLKVRKAVKEGKKAELQWSFDTTFPLTRSLQSLLSLEPQVVGDELLAELKQNGRVRQLVLSGMFTGAEESKIDVLVVFSKLDDKKVARTFSKLESWLGGEIRYAALDEKDYIYRLGLSDRLLRDVYDHSYVIIQGNEPAPKKR